MSQIIDYYDKATQLCAFGASAEYTSNHDVLLDRQTLTEAQQDAILALESCGVRPTRAGRKILVPCFFRAAAAEVLHAS